MIDNMLITQGSCVLTVMMLEWFSPSQLPDGRIYTEPKTEVSSYRQIYTAAKAIENKCTLARDPGWAAIGKCLDVSPLRHGALMKTR